ISVATVVFTASTNAVIYTLSLHDALPICTPLTNTNAVNVQAGVLEFDAGGTGSATSVFTTSAGATTRFNSDFSFASGAQLNGPENDRSQIGTPAISAPRTIPTDCQNACIL